MEIVTFHWADYLTFFAMLVVSAVVGLAFSRGKGGAQSAGGIFVGSRQMTLLPVSLSLFATTMSSVGILGYVRTYIHTLICTYVHHVLTLLEPASNVAAYLVKMQMARGRILSRNHVRLH
jgi:Na+/proline symporter